MATSPLIQLSADELAMALDGIEPIDALAAELVARTAGGQVRQPDRDVRLERWRGHIAPSGLPDTEWVVLEDPRTGPLCLLPTASLRAGRAAVLTGLAARTLLAPGPVTAAILGSGRAVRPQLVIVARHIRGVGRIAICPTRHQDGRHQDGSLIESSLLDQMDLAGIRFAVAEAVEEALVAANLVVTVDSSAGPLDTGHLTRGAVVVNAASRGLPAGLVKAVDQLYVDDATLIERDPDRLAGRSVDADLGQVLSGTHPGRTDRGHMVLVELLGRNILDVRLASLLHRVAVERAIGTRLPG